MSPSQVAVAAGSDTAALRLPFNLLDVMLDGLGTVTGQLAQPPNLP